MQTPNHDPRETESMSVTYAEADQMLKRVLAGQVASETSRPLSEVSQSLGISEQQAIQLLNEIRMKEKAEAESLRVTRGLKREKRVLMIAYAGSIALILIVASVVLLGSRLMAISHARGNTESTVITGYEVSESSATPATPSPAAEDGGTVRDTGGAQTSATPAETDGDKTPATP